MTMVMIRTVVRAVVDTDGGRGEHGDDDGEDNEDGGDGDGEGGVDDEGGDGGGDGEGGGTTRTALSWECL